MNQQNSPIIPSLITYLYAAWEQYQIPAIFYHYTLAILSKKQKKEQVSIMHRQINQLKTGNHMYPQIINAVEARQRSLDIIKRNIHVLMEGESAISLNWDNAEPQVESDGYDLIFQSRGVEKKDNRTLVELINHIRMYQKVTYQVIVSIHRWEANLINEGYNGPIQFIYRHLDYLQKILKDTAEIIDNHPILFEKNTFLIMKKEHQTSQFAIVYQNLKISPDFEGKVNEALQIITDHQIAIEKHRILGSYKQLGSQKKIIKSQNLLKIYCNYNNNKDYLIVKDPFLRSDKLKVDPNNHFKFVSNKNILFNPEITPKKFIERRHPVYINNQGKRQQNVNAKEIPLPRSSSLNHVQIRKIDQKQSLILTTRLDPTLNREKSMHKKLSLYQSLDKTIKYNQSTKNSPFEIVELPQEKQQIVEKQQKAAILLIAERIIQQKSIQSQVKFHYQTGIALNQLYKYLRDDIFKAKQMGINDIETISRRIISEKNGATFIKVTSGEHVAAWMLIKFLTKDRSIRKAIQIIFTYKFFKIPNFEQLLIQQFLKKGYGIIKQNGKIVHQMQLSEKLSHQAIKIKYKVSTNIDEIELKSVIKKNICLKETRILKYHHYSKQSKYHRYCDHKDSCCQIAYEFEQAFKIKISDTNYLRLRCDKITKIGNCYRVFHHFNSTDLLIAKEIEDILDVCSQSNIEFDSSFEGEDSNKYDYICLPQLKIMHKYTDLTEKPFIVEYLSVNGDIPEILSISLDKKTLKNYLFIERPFTIAFMCNSKDDLGKIVSVAIFN